MKKHAAETHTGLSHSFLGKYKYLTSLLGDQMVIQGSMILIQYQNVCLPTLLGPNTPSVNLTTVIYREALCFYEWVRFRVQAERSAVLSNKVLGHSHNIFWLKYYAWLHVSLELSIRGWLKREGLSLCLVHTTDGLSLHEVHTKEGQHLHAVHTTDGL